MRTDGLSDLLRQSVRRLRIHSLGEQDVQVSVIQSSTRDGDGVELPEQTRVSGLGVELERERPHLRGIALASSFGLTQCRAEIHVPPSLGAPPDFAADLGLITRPVVYLRMPFVTFSILELDRAGA